MLTDIFQYDNIILWKGRDTMDNLKMAKELIICYLTDRATKLAMNEDLENFQLVKHELDEIKHGNKDKLYVYIDILRNMFEKAKKEFLEK